MYFWVILATFLAMLASYTLPSRSDIRELTVEPLAQADLAKFVSRHRAAYEYAQFQKPPHKEQINFGPGIVADARIKEYLPYGQVLTEDFDTRIFCLSADQKTEFPTTAGCNDPTAHNVLVTYGPIPERWVNMTASPERPSSDFMNAIRTSVHTGSSEMVGYTIYDAGNVSNPDNVSGSSVRVYDGRNSYRVYVPTGVLNNSYYKAQCEMKSSGDASKVCLVVVSVL